MATAKILHMKENFWDAAKVILIWKYLASTAYIRKGKKKLRTSELSIYLKKAGGGKQGAAHTAELTQQRLVRPPAFPRDCWRRPAGKGQRHREPEH